MNPLPINSLTYLEEAFPLDYYECGCDVCKKNKDKDSNPREDIVAGDDGE